MLKEFHCQLPIAKAWIGTQRHQQCGVKQQGSENLTIRHPRKSRNSPDPPVACVIQSEFVFPSFQILLPVV